MLLAYPNNNTPSNPRALWSAFKSFMADDYISLQKYTEHEAYVKTLQAIDSFLQSTSRTIDEFGLVDFIIGASKEQLQGQDYDQELNYPVSDFDLKLIAMLNSEQSEAFKEIMQTLDAHDLAAFFVDGPAGSGVAASLLPGGFTVHSRFKLPIIVEDEACTISKQSVHASVIKAAKLIIWDEASMAHRKRVEAFDSLLRDLMENNLPFGESYDQPLDELLSEIFQDFGAHTNNPTSLIQRAILTPKNECVHEINTALIDKFPGVAVDYYSTDITTDPFQQAYYQDYLNY
ncbi:hypothetical protein OROMI_002780 [Orobanche minor]